ncbi:hypothetical protein GCM10010924_52910 [Rhizobium wenxiniae]|nr:hypothetical protein GCM10010924_52910 [Rhizobium wenxiniae]
MPDGSKQNSTLALMLALVSDRSNTLRILVEMRPGEFDVSAAKFRYLLSKDSISL